MESFVPVLLGLDLGAYSMAISFYDGYGVKSHAFGKYKCGITYYSSIVKTHIVKDMDKEEIGVAALFSFAEKMKGKRLVLVPCSDWYLCFLEKTREKLRDKFDFLIPDTKTYQKLSNKDSFYEVLRDHGVPYPETVVWRKEDDGEPNEHSSVPFPAVLKPSNSVSYWEHPFSGMKKVYFPENMAEARKIADTVFLSGYDKSLILQEKIEATECGTLTVLVGKDGRVKRAVLGKILLEENGKTARGNYAAIVTAPLDEIGKRLVSLVKGVGYTGVCNFDILYREGEAYVLEMNPRQGRSCDYLRAGGVCLAEFILSELYGDDYRASTEYPVRYWHCISHKAVAKYTDREDLLAIAENEKKEKRDVSPFYYGTDLRFRPFRFAYVKIHEKRRERAFRND